MKKSRFSEEQIIGILREAEGTSVKEVCARNNISAATYYGWKNKFSGMDVNEARRFRALEDENRRLKNLVAESMRSSGAKEQRRKPVGPWTCSARPIIATGR